MDIPYHRHYYQKNRERILEYAKIWRDTHKEELHIYRTEYMKHWNKQRKEKELQNKIDRFKKMKLKSFSELSQEDQI